MEPLHADVVGVLSEAVAAGRLKEMPRVIGGRYGLSSKDFNPGMAKAVFDELKKPNPKNHFTVGIIDDVSHTCLDYDRMLDIEPDDTVRCLFFGLGADGTVGANKNSVKILSRRRQIAMRRRISITILTNPERDGLPSPFRQDPDWGTLFDQARQFRRLPQIQLSQQA